jgi:hypothetical protein
VFSRLALQNRKKLPLLLYGTTLGFAALFCRADSAKVPAKAAEYIFKTLYLTIDYITGKWSMPILFCFKNWHRKITRALLCRMLLRCGAAANFVAPILEII